MDTGSKFVDTRPGAMPGAGYAPQPLPSRRGTSIALWLLAGLAVLAVAAVVGTAVWFAGLARAFDRLPTVTVGELRVESQSVPQKSAGSVAVNVTMENGELILTGGATDLLDANFTYNVDAWKPIVTYTEAGSQGALNIQQTHLEGFIRYPEGTRNNWKLRLQDGLPLTLTASLGAGTSTLKLGGLSISELNLSTGAGESTIDLTGQWKQNLKATLETGVGMTTIRLPKDAGVRLNVEGLGAVDGGGLSHNGSYYTNAAYGKAPVTLEIKVSTGIGNVKIIP